MSEQQQVVSFGIPARGGVPDLQVTFTRGFNAAISRDERDHPVVTITYRPLFDEELTEEAPDEETTAAEEPAAEEPVAEEEPDVLSSDDEVDVVAVLKRHGMEHELLADLSHNRLDQLRSVCGEIEHDCAPDPRLLDQIMDLLTPGFEKVKSRKKKKATKRGRRPEHPEEQ